MSPHWKGDPLKKKTVTKSDPPIGKSTHHGNQVWFGGVYKVKGSK